MIRLTVIGLCVLLAHLTDCISSHYPVHRYMTHYYFNHQDAHVNDSLVLELSNRFLPDTRKDILACDIKLVTSSTNKLLVHFISLGISDEDDHFDRLHIYDFNADDTVKRLSPRQGLYGVYDKYYSRHSAGLEDYISSGNRLKLEYHGKPTLAYAGFKILITSYRESRGGCGRGYFRCSQSDICIPSSTWCDGFNNCGNDDNSDEASCEKGLGSVWKPWDGQVTAVIVASVACTMFLITTGIIILVITRINKRDALNANITVEFKKRSKGKRKQQNRENLYAPPSYEIVVNMDEAPPPYESVENEYDSESDTGSEVLNDHLAKSTDGACATTPSEDNIESSIVQVTSALVTCDLEGNNVKTKINETSSDVTKMKNKEFQELSNYKLCSTVDDNNTIQNQKKMPLQNGIVHLDEIEVLSSEENDSFKDENSNSQRQKLTNGIVRNGTKTPNGNIHKIVDTSKCNGHSKVMYRSPSKREGEIIDFIDSD